MTARGLRNNNPGNIRLGEAWNGLVDNPAEKSFCTFVCATYGIRALCKVLLTYQKRYDLDTIGKIIDRYAPVDENDTNAYAKHVADVLNVPVDAPVDLTDAKLMEGVVRAIIQHENGSCPYTFEITDGMLLAGIK